MTRIDRSEWKSREREHRYASMEMLCPQYYIKVRPCGFCYRLCCYDRIFRACRSSLIHILVGSTRIFITDFEVNRGYVTQSAK